MAMEEATRSRFMRVAFISAAVVLTAAFSCKTFDLPDEICDPTRIDAKRLRGEPADGECARCLEERCCDKIGICERKEGCEQIVSSVHECVLAADLQGAAAEATCAGPLSRAPEANDTYRCMRTSCGQQCGLPVCKVDQAAALLQTASCDRCFSSSCCPQLNACYRSRACKLMLECITDECGAALGQSLIDVRKGGDLMMGRDGGGGPAQDDIARICSGAGDFSAPPCVRDCLCRFRDNDQGLLPDEELRPFTLASRIYECGARADCGPRCPPPTVEARADARADGP